MTDADPNKKEDRGVPQRWSKYAAVWGPIVGGLLLFAAIVVQNQVGIKQLDKNMTAGLQRLDKNMIGLRQEVNSNVMDIVDSMGDRFRSADHEIHMTQEYRPLQSRVTELLERVTRLEAGGVR